METISITPRANGFQNEIFDEIRKHFNTVDEMKSELRRYCDSFPQEDDYNFAQHGNITHDIPAIRARFRKWGLFACLYNDDDMWKIYLRNVGKVINYILGINGYKGI